MKGPWSTWSITSFAATRAGARPGRKRSITLNQYVSNGPTQKHPTAPNFRRARGAVLDGDALLALDGLRRAVARHVGRAGPERFDAVGVGCEARVVPGQEAAAGERHWLLAVVARVRAKVRRGSEH